MDDRTRACSDETQGSIRGLLKKWKGATVLLTAARVREGRGSAAGSEVLYEHCLVAQVRGVCLEVIRHSDSSTVHRTVKLDLDTELSFVNGQISYLESPGDGVVIVHFKKSGKALLDEFLVPIRARIEILDDE